MLSGYKTYITGVLAIATAIGAYISGDATVMATAQLVFTALLGMFVRAGINK